MMDIFNITPQNIWCFRQNHPELVVKDLSVFGETVAKTARASLLARGVNKWLKVRRDLIAYKKQVKHEVKRLQDNVIVLKREMQTKAVNPDKSDGISVHEYHKAREKYLIAKELLKYKQKLRGDLKSMCMTDRYQLWEGKKLSDMNTIKASDNEI